LLAGVIIGLAVALPLRRGGLSVRHDARVATGVVQLGAGTPSAWVQAVLGALATGVVLLAWQLAIRH
jgi:hypothetical protein